MAIPAKSFPPKEEFWECLLYAFHYVTGVELDTIRRIVGHDGSEFLDFAKTIHRGFCPQELMGCIQPYLGMVSVIEYNPILKWSKEDISPPNRGFDFSGTKELFSKDEQAERMEFYITNTNGIVIGQREGARWRHALANFKGEVWDPDTGKKTSLVNFNIDEYYAIWMRKDLET